MTDQAFKKKIKNELKSFESKLKAIARAKGTESERRRWARELRQKLREDSDRIFVGEYTVHAHFRRARPRKPLLKLLSGGKA